ncbi:hypothetical protein Plim_1458 [Planctopirus limnophila DSM 3776]|uniref:Uncharacterized protein n=1 Tax=Planctopirus limnophila (strain ATCC 43296 / DSM 3776 / IFAM 1008 / Mu 290) TaxID=521674 RepID=D5SW07_PLAL2|nr:hypothetical protein [Planctopirus limnophila]ADG67292.1 hypothetical protein Plim_1458 [Planctopirus limnophila DSM 3776]
MSHERGCQFQADEEFVRRFFCFEEIEELPPAEEFVSPEELLPGTNQNWADHHWADQHWEVRDGREFFLCTKPEESLPLVDFFEPAPLVRRVRDRLVAHAVVTERRVKDRRQRQIAAQSFVFAMLMVISPWVSWNLINQSAFKEVQSLLCEAMAPRHRMVIASRSVTSREHDPEQELIDRLAHQRRQILFSLPALATPALVTSR